MPVIIRLDGRSFHTLTRRCEKPFDATLADCMVNSALYLCSEVQGVKCAYIQSDEISLLLTDFDTLTTMAWFDYNIQKVVSISASLTSVKFSKLWKRSACFDSRAFNIPKEETANYFVWRQKDWIRNSVAMLAQAHFSHTQLHQKRQPDMHEMLHGKGINWAELEPRWKNGQFIEKDDGVWTIKPAPIFTQNRVVIERYLESTQQGVD
ncbi:hypothetical protein LCGC14_0628000 [marine sediment metagenome]|uniref:tRNAHis guanylyltransferase catalytic domain-containing protein n=1 Tax=marine sediment metagenome TaxID=412755 RepID=A0A0F9R2W5_9ZZZZ